MSLHPVITLHWACIIRRLPGTPHPVLTGSSVAEYSSSGGTYFLIVYYGLPNQCYKCKEIGHIAKACPSEQDITSSGEGLAQKSLQWQTVNRRHAFWGKIKLICLIEFKIILSNIFRF